MGHGAVSLSVSHLLSAAGAVAVGASVVKVAPETPSVWTILILGIPLGVLIASMAASSLRHMRDPSQPDKKIAAQVLSMLFDGFAGGWLAMFIVSVPFTRGYVGDVVRPEVIGALCALTVQFLRDHGKSYLDEAFKTVLALFGRKRNAP